MVCSKEKSKQINGIITSAAFRQDRKPIPDGPYMTTTKKLLAALNKDGKPSRKTDFLVPDIEGKQPFKTIRKAELYENGYVVLIGKEISIQDLIDRIEYPVDDLDGLKKTIRNYFQQIKDFKIGNIVTASFQESKKLKLTIVSKSWRGLKK